MGDSLQLGTGESVELLRLYKDVYAQVGDVFSYEEKRLLKHILSATALQQGEDGENPLLRMFRVIAIVHNGIGLGRTAILGILLHRAVAAGVVTADEIAAQFGENVLPIINGLNKINELYGRNVVVESENFRRLLLSFAENVQVIFIILAERLDTMRHLSKRTEAEQERIAEETSYLYAPLAHRMGLYAIKTELEDLSLKYTLRDTYKDIAKQLAQNKRSRDQYIVEFIEPIKKKLEDAGFKFDIKGRTKSIHSIWKKMVKQNTTLDHIYDLFAIRIILDCPVEREKAECWQVYSIITDMYTPNPKRLRDWLSIPKLNGYESLHITVMGPQGKWVEVQIRTRRMDEIAEKGLAAHWKYKGIKGEQGIDEWLKNIREMLENPESNAIDYMDNFKLNLYDEEVFVFTPKGDLCKLQKGATILDFAYHIHSNIGNHCIGAIVNGKHVQMRYPLRNGDQVEIQTSATQHPKLDWLNIVVTTKAKSRIRQSIKEIERREAEDGRGKLLRRLKNWKIEYDDAVLSRTSKKFGYKELTSFYQAINNGAVDMLALRDAFTPAEKPAPVEQQSAQNYTLHTEAQLNTKNDPLLIDRNIKSVNYQFARCCNPIYGDDIFGFVTIGGKIKIHRRQCPNAPQMRARYAYRIIPVQWSGINPAQYPITLRIVGQDNIGIVNNITSVISKECNVNIRTISIQSHDGLFLGTISVAVDDTKTLDNLMRKIKTIKGIKQITRE